MRRSVLLGSLLAAAVAVPSPAAAPASSAKAPLALNIGYGGYQLVGDPWRATGPKGAKGLNSVRKGHPGRGRSQMARKRRRRHHRRWRA